MNLDIKKIIIGVLYLGYLVYLYVLFNSWSLASGGNMFMEIIQGTVPLSAIVFINLIFQKKIRLSIPI